MKAWLAAHRYSARSALARYARRPIAAIFESAVIGIALALPLAFLLAVENVRSFAARHPATPEISIYLGLDATAEQIESVRQRLARIDGVLDVRFVSRAEATQRLRRSSGLAEILDALPGNPLPDAFTVRLGVLDPVRLDALAAELASSPAIAKVQVDSDWAQKLDALVRTGRLAAAGLTALLAGAMLAVTYNTVRLQMLQRQDEIALSHLIGATAAFVRRPYVYFGALQGFFGAAAALALVAGLNAVAAKELAYLSTIYGFSLEPGPLPWATAPVVLAAGTLLGCVAAWLCAAQAQRARELRR